MSATQLVTVTEIWMVLKDASLLRQLMEARGISARQLASAAGWKSHSYMNRLLAGEVKTLSTDPALKIAHRLQIPVDLLFLTKVSSDAARTNKSGRAA